MANVEFNIAKGIEKHYASQAGVGNAALIMLLLKTTGLQADSTLIDHDNISVMLGAGNVECDFTNYSRKTITAATITIDDTNNWVDIDIADQTFGSPSGGATNNTIGAVILAFDNDTTTGNDVNLVPMFKWDCGVTTDGITSFVAAPAAAGIFRAA